MANTNFLMLTDKNSPDKILIGTAASYAKTISFTFPIEIENHISIDESSYGVSWTGDHIWELIPKAGASKFNLHSKRYVLQFYSSKSPRFGSTKAEFLIKDDGSIICKLLETPKPYEPKAYTPRSSYKSKEKKRKEVYSRTEIEIRAKKVIADIKSIETETGYRLVSRPGGFWGWHAPEIIGDDEENQYQHKGE